MTMNISILTSAMSGSVYAQTQIPQYLKAKLIELGIDPNDVQSAAEARALIQQAEVEQRQKTQSGQNTKNEQSSADSNSQNSNESPALRQKVAILAEKLGVSVSENQTIEDILSNIQTVLDKLFETAAKNNDEGLYNALVGLQHQLDELKTEAKGGAEPETKIYSFMDMLAQQNKFMHNINF